MNLVEDLLIVRKSPNLTIRAKTGWAMRIKNQHGWYIGYVERRNETWFFAMNLDIKSEADARIREELTLQALKMKGIL